MTCLFHNLSREILLFHQLLVSIASCAIVLGIAGPSYAVIEPGSTPVDMIQQATTVAAFGLTRSDDQFVVNQSALIVWKGDPDAIAALVVSDSKEFAQAAALSRLRVILVTVKLQADATRATRFVLAGDRWFELTAAEKGVCEPQPRAEIRWFFGAGVDVLEPAFAYCKLAKSPRFPRPETETWSPLFSRKIAADPAGVLPVRIAELSTEAIHVIGAGQSIQAQWQLGESDVAISLLEGESGGTNHSRGASLNADFNNDGVADMLSIRQGRIAVQIAGSDTPIMLFKDAMVPVTDVACLAICDLNRDGDFDFIAGGKDGCRLFFGSGNATFREVTYACGAVQADRVNVTDVIVCDRDGDRHEDLLLISSSSPPCALRNLGFGVFGVAEYRLPSRRSESADELFQLAIKASHVASDVIATHGGAPDLVFVSAAGNLAVARCDWTAKTMPVSLLAATTAESPIRVVAHDGVVCLGARNTATDRVVRFAKLNRGPLDLKWSDAGGAVHKHRLIVLKSLDWELPSNAQRRRE